jgi:hypothetical protein
VLAHLRNGDTRDRLAGGFEVSATTVWRYVREAVDLLAAAPPTLSRAGDAAHRPAGLRDPRRHADPDRPASGSANRRYFSGKHRRHGVNDQVIADPHGRLMWVSPA